MANLGTGIPLTGKCMYNLNKFVKDFQAIIHLCLNCLLFVYLLKAHKRYSYIDHKSIFDRRNNLFYW